MEMSWSCYVIRKDRGYLMLIDSFFNYIRRLCESFMCTKGVKLLSDGL